jgi:hypothetical protein
MGSGACRMRKVSPRSAAVYSRSRPDAIKYPLAGAMSREN